MWAGSNHIGLWNGTNSHLLRDYIDGWTTEDLIFEWREIEPVQVPENMKLPRFIVEKVQTDFCSSNTTTGDISANHIPIARMTNYLLLKGCIRVWKWTCSSSANSPTTWSKSTSRAACWLSYRGCLSGWTPMRFQLACLSALQLSWRWPHKLLASTTHCLPFPTRRYPEKRNKRTETQMTFRYDKDRKLYYNEFKLLMIQWLIFLLIRP